MERRPLFLFTDFGYSGPYVGQMHAAILSVDPRLKVVDLMHDAPAMRPDLAACLLPRVCHCLPDNAVVVAVVDPGVGGDREPLIVETASTVFVGPDNGLFAHIPDVQRVWRLDWHPSRISVSFHGRDLFAPAAALLASGQEVPRSGRSTQMPRDTDVAMPLERVVFIDAFGNLMTGIPGDLLMRDCRLQVGSHTVKFAETFCKSSKNVPFWYCNSLGLAEIALARGSAADDLAVAVGDRILVHC
jgi:S-adenosylmethionine hydrolase